MSVRDETMLRLGEFDTSWLDDAACTDEPTEMFFPTRGRPSNEGNAAKAICAVCPVREPCLDYALATYQLGIWGGTNGKDRQQIRRRAQRRGAA